ncbi:YCF48-related protein [Paenibacillus sp. SI8]|uniref:YCF48-related protein n=1 Tax=unclassified Paenibacillus TaxID=185978 RepID=UPI003466ECCA
MSGTKKYIYCLIFLLCSGCFQEEAASPSPTETVSSKQTPVSGFTVAARSDVVVDEQTASYSLSKLDFIDDQNGMMVKETEGQEPTLLQTADGGVSWHEASIPAFTVSAIEMVQSNSVWAAVKTGCKEQDGTMSCQEEQLLHTSDQGQSWELKWSRKKPNSARALAQLTFINSHEGFMQMDGEVIHTQDGGAQWELIDFGLKNFRAEHYSFIDSRQGWVIGTLQSALPKEQGAVATPESASSQLIILRTADGGAHWSKQSFLTAATNQFHSVGLKFIDANHGWLLTSNLDTMRGGLFTTADGGAHWTQINDIQSARPAPADMQFVGQVGWIPLDRGAGPVDGGLMMTKDGGTHFQTIGADKGWSIHAVDLISAREGWAVGISPNRSDYLIHTKDAGTTWSQAYPPLSPSKAVAFIDNLHGYGLTSGLENDLFIETKDSGLTWHPQSSIPSSYQNCMLTFLDAQTGWLLTSDSADSHSNLRLTSDGGRTWEVIARDLLGLDRLGDEPYFQFFDRQNGLIAATGVKEMVLLRTQDGGLTWSASSRIPLPKANGGTVTFISPTQGWLIGQGKKGDEETYVFRMQDGETWQETGKLPGRLAPQALSFTNARDGWMLLHNYVDGKEVQWLLMRTGDGGDSWTQQAFPETFHPLDLNIQMNVISSSTGWLLGMNALWSTVDGGSTWKLMDNFLARTTKK